MGDSFKLKKEDSKMIQVLVFILGSISMIFQLQIVREVLFMFGGNEIVYGVVISLWLLGFGLGAWLSSFDKFSLKKIHRLVFLELALPPFFIVLARLIKKYWIVGVAKEFSFILLISAFLTFPFPFLYGFILAKLSYLKKRGLGDVYLWDALGDLTGATLFLFLLITLNTLKSAVFVSLISLFFFILYLIHFVHCSKSSPCRRLRGQLIKLFLLLGVFIFSFFIVASFLHSHNLDEALLPPTLGKLVEFKESKLGRIVIADSFSQRNYFYDGVPIGDNATLSEAEMLTYVPLAIRKNAKRFLLIKPFFLNEIKALAPFPNLNISVVSPDKSLVNEILQRENLSLQQNIRIFTQDPYAFLKHIKKNSTRFDVIAIGDSGIYSYRDNRLFSAEFFEMLRQVISPQGIIILPLEGGENVIPEARKVILSSVYNALRKSFPHIIYIPGETIYFIASPLNLSYSFIKRLDQMNSSYANSMYLSPLLEKERMKMVNDSLSFTKLMNTNLKPVSFYYSLLNWFKLTGSKPLWVFLIVSGLIASVLFRYEWSEAPLFTSGMILSSLGVVFTILLSISVGYGFYGIALITLLFMGGSFLGALLGKRLLRKRFLSLKHFGVYSELALILFLTLLLLIVLRLQVFPSYLLVFFLMLLNFLISIVGGIQFIAIGSLRKTYAPRHTFSADAFGAFVGAFFFSIFLIPYLGISLVVLLLLGIKFFSLIGFTVSKNV